MKNTSQRDGDEVVELYLTFPKLSGAPIRALRGFTRVHIRAGETAHVRLALNSRDLSYVNDAGDRIIAPGILQRLDRRRTAWYGRTRCRIGLYHHRPDAAP